VYLIASRSLTGVASGRKVQIFRTTRQIGDVWAPEMHRVGGRYYVYFAGGGNGIHVLTADRPLGPYAYVKEIVPGQSAIDPTLLRHAGRLYLLYVSHSSIYILPLADPLTPQGPAAAVCTASLPWEGSIAEAPEILTHAGRTFLIYSARGAETPDYCYGLCELMPGADPTRPGSWVKRPTPVFTRYSGPDGVVYGPGHGAFTVSPDGREDWMVYHAKLNPAPNYDRDLRMQRYTWGADGMPVFGHPIPAGVPQRVPSGQRSSGQTGQVRNPGFERPGAGGGVPEGWDVWGGRTGESVDAARREPGGHGGAFRLALRRDSPYSVVVHQGVTGLRNGDYTLSAWVRSGGGQQSAALFARLYGGPERRAEAPAGGGWTRVQIRDIAVTTHSLELGLTTRAGAGQWLWADDVTLALQPPRPTERP
jgi:GH43 family beta-xylosidase